MEKIFLKPVANEIITRSTSVPGHADTFSYDAQGREDTRKMGSLFIVGHAQQNDEDVAYMVNLLASLAKREYFSNPHLGPKDAFSNTLKKINEVVQDFFKNQGLELNLGVFAIAGEQIYISKLGKFKIFLAREDKVIDVLNNVDLFEKELTDEKEFSNIISGKISADDKILAFNPVQAISSREKTIKANFASLNSSEFSIKIQQLKTKNETFGCAMMHVSIKKVREIATPPKVKSPIASEAPVQVNLAQTSKETKEISTVPSKPVPVVISGDPMTTQEVPRIISSEFSLGRRANPVLTFFKRFHWNFHLNTNFPKKTFMAVVLGTVVMISGWSAKSFISSHWGNSEVRTAINQAKDNAKLAQTKVDEKDITGARSLLVSSIASLQSLKDDKAMSQQKNLFALLDTIDHAQEISPTLAWQPENSSDPIGFLTASGSSIFAYWPAGRLGKIDNGSLLKTFEVTDLNPTILTMGAHSPILIDLEKQSIAYLVDDKIKTQAAAIPTGAKSAYFYQNNLYVLASGIYKIPNIVSPSSKAQSWLQSNTSTPVDALQLLVDGNIFVVTKSGMIVNYYKGAKISEVPTGLYLNKDASVLTTSDSISLYIVDAALNRIYIVDKKLGTLTKTYKIDSKQTIGTAAIGEDETIYFTTGDGKIWRVNPLDR